MWTEAFISGRQPPAFTGVDMLLRWTCTAPPGYATQVYIDEQLAYHGPSTTQSCHLPWPSGYVRIDIGNVLAGEANRDFSADLVKAPLRRAELEWLGGTFLDPTLQGDIAGFHVYGEPGPGAGIDYTAPLADIGAYIAQATIDGYGYGGFGLGGFGLAAGSYEWTSGPLTSGTWTFAVTSYSYAGNESPPQTVAVVINVPPLPPAPFDDMTRLRYSILGFNQYPFGQGGFGLPEAILEWNASPLS